MRGIFAVYKREIGLYFRSAIAYAIAFALLLFMGLLFSGQVSGAVENNISGGQMYGSMVDADSILGFTPSTLTFLLFLIAPLLTMRLLAEESREGTLETLMTLPIREAHFIVGKFLAAWTYYTVLLGLTLIYLVIMSQIGVPDLGRTFSQYLGAWLYGGAVLAVTMIWSAITEDQVVAAFLGAATVLVLYLADVAAQWVSQQQFTASASEFVRQLGLTAHFQATLMEGIIRAEDIAYFVFLIIGALFITTRIVETRRWRA